MISIYKGGRWRSPLRDPSRSVTVVPAELFRRSGAAHSLGRRLRRWNRKHVGIRTQPLGERSVVEEASIEIFLIRGISPRSFNFIRPVGRFSEHGATLIFCRPVGALYVANVTRNARPFYAGWKKAEARAKHELVGSASRNLRTAI